MNVWRCKLTNLDFYSFLVQIDYVDSSRDFQGYVTLFWVVTLFKALMSNYQWYVSLFWTYVFVLSNPISHFSCKKFKDWFLWKITYCIAASIFCINGIALLACFPFLFPFWSAGRTFFSLDYHEMRFGDEGGIELVLLSCGTLSGLFDQDFQRRRAEVKTWTQTDAQREKCRKIHFPDTLGFPRDFCPLYP